MSDFQKQKLNLKGRTGKRIYYRNNDTGRVAEKVRILKGQPQTYFTPILDRVYFTENNVRKFNLGRLGKPLP
ncbi:replication initiation factor RepA, partial [Bacillus cereus]|nr:replication initiation factor RepA [Bacillus cereus]